MSSHPDDRRKQAFALNGPDGSISTRSELRFVLFRKIFCHFGDGWLGGIAVPGGILIKIAGRRREAAQGVTERRRRLSWHYAAQFDSSILNTTVGSGCCWKIW
jgi:hypothetical protein